MSTTDLLDSGLLVLRLLLGTLLVAHGALKFFQGGGLEAEATLLAKDGLRGGKPAAALSALIQVGAGTFLAAGFLTPLAGAGAIGAMMVAVCAKARNGFWVPHDGLEFPLIFAVLSVTATLTGPGQWSLDHAIGLSITSTETLIAIAAGLVAGAASFPALLAPRRARTPNIESQHPA